MVADDLSRLSIGNTSYVEEENMKLSKDVHILSRFGVRLTNSTEERIVVLKFFRTKPKTNRLIQITNMHNQKN